MLADSPGTYLPKGHKLTILLNELLALAEQRCNYMLLPCDEMNCNRYVLDLKTEKIWIYDFIPSTMYHVFDKEALGRFFDDEDAVRKWVRRESLECAFIK